MNGEQQFEGICETAALYSLGALPKADALQFEKQLATGCAACQLAYQQSADVLEYLPLAAPPVQPRQELKQRLMDRVATGERPPGAVAGPTVVRAEDTPWQPAPVPGVEYKPLLGDRTLLVRMRAGASYPAHPHHLAEQCYVIEGSVTDAAGLTVYAGDFVCMPAGSVHTTIRTETGCVFLLSYSH